jgi:UDP-N-acetylmuramyl pentapeptide phosphotransferase/UDP-N-acetylglucosamine-1-phosphate transferase
MRIALAFALSLATSFCFTEGARRLAIRTAFLDHPVGYKGHAEATPYLGGLAVTAALLAVVEAAGAVIGFRDAIRVRRAS